MTADRGRQTAVKDQRRSMTAWMHEQGVKARLKNQESRNKKKIKSQKTNHKTCPSLFEGQIPNSNDRNNKQKNAVAHQRTVDWFCNLVLAICDF